jgi:hypothetical protein
MGCGKTLKRAIIPVPSPDSGDMWIKCIGVHGGPKDAYILFEELDKAMINDTKPIYRATYVAVCQNGEEIKEPYYYGGAKAEYRIEKVY